MLHKRQRPQPCLPTKVKRDKFVGPPPTSLTNSVPCHSGNSRSTHPVSHSSLRTRSNLLTRHSPTHPPKVKRAKFIAAETRRRRAESSLVKQAQLDDKLDAAAARRASSRASSPLSSPLARPAKRCAPPPTTAALMRG